LALLARETGGISRFVTPRERADLAAVDLFASIGQPVAMGLKASANVRPEPPDSVFAGAPVLLFGEVDRDEDKRIRLTWDGGSLDVQIPSGDADTGETVRLLRGSRQITDWEIRYPTQEALASLEKRKESRVRTRLLELSNAYGLANREMSLVAVTKRPGDRVGELPETRVVPVGIPQDTAFGAYFGAIDAPQYCRSVEPLSTAGRPLARAYVAPLSIRQAFSPQANTANSADLLDLTAKLQPDGGMPGDNSEVRAARSVAALLAFVAAGHTLTKGAFRLHVNRLVTFLKEQTLADPGEKALFQRAIDAASTGDAPPGEWLALVGESCTRWEQVDRMMKLKPIASN
jgi:hypothetical protein